MILAVIISISFLVVLSMAIHEVKAFCHGLEPRVQHFELKRRGFLRQVKYGYDSNGKPGMQIIFIDGPTQWIPQKKVEVPCCAGNEVAVFSDGEKWLVRLARR